MGNWVKRIECVLSIVSYSEGQHKPTSSYVLYYETQECLHSAADGCYRDSLDVTAKLMNAENKTCWVIHVIHEPQCNPDTQLHL